MNTKEFKEILNHLPVINADLELSHDGDYAEGDISKEEKEVNLDGYDIFFDLTVHATGTFCRYEAYSFDGEYDFRNFNIIVDNAGIVDTEEGEELSLTKHQIELLVNEISNHLNIY